MPDHAARAPNRSPVERWVPDIVAAVYPPSPTAADLTGRFVGRLAIVEPLAAEHEQGLIEAASEPELFAWMPVDMASSRDAVRDWLSTTIAAAQGGREVPYAIIEASSGAVVGSTRFLELRFEHLRAEIGWTWLARRAWSTGINVETKLMLLEHAFEHAGLRRVEFKTDARNERSRGALLALGTKFEGILRKHMVVRDGGERDSAYYSVIDDEWPALRQQLRRRVDEHAARSCA
jgi:RimJ/RimL family protein N-acetyltransferase